MSHVPKNENLFKIRDKFLCCVSINEFGLEDLLVSLSWEEQYCLLKLTIKSDLLTKYPIKASYQKAFLKTVIEILEKSCTEVHDDLYVAFCNILRCEDSEKYYFKHYIVENRVVTLKESKSFISEGTTGLCSWQASLALSQWCINNKPSIKDKTILELGSGVGLVGLTILTHCNPKEIILSDCHPKVLTVLSENVSLNINNNLNKLINETNEDILNCDSEKLNSDRFVSSNFGAKKTFGSGFGASGCESDSDIANANNAGTLKILVTDNSVVLSIKNKNSKISVVNLPWEKVAQNEFCAQVVPDLILAADVVYDNSVFKPLCGAIKYFLDKNREANVILACTERNCATLQEFVDLLESTNFHIKNLVTPNIKDFFWSDAVPIRFFLVRNK